MKITWNAHIHVEETNVKWVGLGWGVPGDQTPTHYEALITVTVPEQATAFVGKQAPNETVMLTTSADLPCGPDLVAVDVTYRVVALDGATGDKVEINIAENAGQKPVPTGAVLAQGAGGIGEDITVRVEIPGFGR